MVLDNRTDSEMNARAGRGRGGGGGALHEEVGGVWDDNEVSG